MGFVEGDGPRSAPRQRNQIVDSKRAVELPAGLSFGANIGIAEFWTASAAKPVPVVDKIAIKHVKANFDMFPRRN